MNYTRYITLDINAISPSTVVVVKQGDTSTRYVNVTLTKDDEQYIPEAGVTAVFRYEKSDGYGGLNTAAIQSDGSIMVELSSQVTVVSGKVLADICLMKNGEVLSTVSFTIDVLPVPNVTQRAVSSDDFKILSELISGADKPASGTGVVMPITFIPVWQGEGIYTISPIITTYPVTASTQVDLMCDDEVKNILAQDRVRSIYIKNDSGVLTAYATGGKPTSTITVQGVFKETRPA